MQVKLNINFMIVCLCVCVFFLRSQFTLEHNENNLQQQ